MRFRVALFASVETFLIASWITIRAEGPLRASVESREWRGNSPTFKLLASACKRSKKCSPFINDRLADYKSANIPDVTARPKLPDQSSKLSATTPNFARTNFFSLNRIRISVGKLPSRVSLAAFETFSRFVPQNFQGIHHRRATFCSLPASWLRVSGTPDLPWRKEPQRARCLRYLAVYSQGRSRRSIILCRFLCFPVPGVVYVARCRRYPPACRASDYKRHPFATFSMYVR